MVFGSVFVGLLGVVENRAVFEKMAKVAVVELGSKNAVAERAEKSKLEIKNGTSCIRRWFQVVWFCRRCE